MPELHWGKVRDPELTEQEKDRILLELNDLAKNYPKGFTFSLPSGKEVSTKKFLGTIENIKYDEFSDFVVAIAQNTQDLQNLLREM